MNGETVVKDAVDKNAVAKGAIAKDAVTMETADRDAIVSEAVATYVGGRVGKDATYSSCRESERHCPPPCPNPEAIRTPEAACIDLLLRVRSSNPLTMEQRESLKLTTFSNWEHSELELFLYLRQMFADLGFLQTFDIHETTVENFLHQVYSRYNRVPFHNFSHCFMVAQMTYALVWTNQLWTIYSQLELMCLLVAAICHDLDHPGLSNHYQRRAGTVLAVRHRDAAPLENHHLAVTFKILADERCDLLKRLSPQDCLRARETIVRLILATDMSRHRSIIAEFSDVADAFDFDKPRHRELLLQMLVKTADVSNEARPLATADKWIDCLLKEFFHEARLLKAMGEEPLRTMDPDVVEKAQSQCEFLNSVALPMTQLLARVFPDVADNFVTPIRRHLQYYTDIRDSSN